MPPITWTDVTNQAPELASFPAGGQTDVLALVNDALSLSVFRLGDADPKYKLARVYLAAHLASEALSNSTGAAGPVTAETALGLSRQYSDPASILEVGDFSTTSYGRMYRTIIRSTIARLPGLC